MVCYRALGRPVKNRLFGLQKRLTFDYDRLELSYITSTLGLLFLVPIRAWYLYHTDVRFTLPVVAVIVVSGVANIGAIGAFLTALELEDLSVVTPLMQSTPIAVAIAEPFVLAVEYDAGVILGATAAVTGAYVLLSGTGGLSAPVRRITDLPALLALSAALLFATASIANQYAVTHVPPLFYAFSITRSWPSASASSGSFVVSASSRENYSAVASSCWAD